MPSNVFPPVANPHFRDPERSPYELVRLLIELPSDFTELVGATPYTRLQANAALKHAANASGTLLDGIEAISGVLFHAVLNTDSAPSSQCVADVAALIKHLVVEVQAMRLVEDNLRTTLAMPVEQVTVGGH